MSPASLYSEDHPHPSGGKRGLSERMPSIAHNLRLTTLQLNTSLSSHHGFTTFILRPLNHINLVSSSYERLTRGYTRDIARQILSLSLNLSLTLTSTFTIPR